MPDPSVLCCPYCALSLENVRALPGAQVRCPSCRRPVLVLAPPTEPPSRPPPLPRAVAFTRHVPLVVGVLLLVGLALVVAACVTLRKRQEERRIAQANAQVTALLDTARVEMKRQHWDRAIQVLKEAETIERADNRAAIAPVLLDARRGQAQALQEAAQMALQRQAAAEQQQRDLKRQQEQAEGLRRQQEAVRLEARLRSMPAFRELEKFVAQTLAQAREAQAEQEQDLDALFQSLGINDPAEQAEMRQRLRQDSDRTEAARRAAGKRAVARLAFRRSAEFRTTDAPVFDRLIDQELAKLPK